MFIDSLFSGGRLQRASGSAGGTGGRLGRAAPMGRLSSWLQRAVEREAPTGWRVGRAAPMGGRLGRAGG